MNKEPTQQEGWEKRFNEEFGAVDCSPIHAKSAIKFFIRSLLREQREEILKEIKKALPEEEDTLLVKDKAYTTQELGDVIAKAGYNQALTETKSLLSKLQNK